VKKQFLLLLIAVFFTSCGKTKITEPVSSAPVFTSTINVTVTITPTISATPSVTPTATVTITNTPDTVHPIGSIYAHPHNQTVSSGDSYKLDIGISANAAVGSFLFTIFFDKDVTEVDGSVGLGGYAEPIPVYEMISINKTIPGQISVYGYDQYGHTASGTVLYIFFRTLSSGVSNYTITVDSLKNTWNASIGTPAGIGGTVIVQ